MEKTSKKPLSTVARKSTTTKTTSQTTTDPNPTPETEMTQKTQEESNSKPKNKSVSFSKIKHKFIPDGGPQSTPLRLPSVVKSRSSGTPYHISGRCRFDMLETSSYWLTQIKMAESVEKHSISAAFFRLAFLAVAEPFPSIRIELKKYLARHEHLSTKKEWKDVCIDYGLVKNEDCKGEQETGEKAEEHIVEVHGEELHNCNEVGEESTPHLGLVGEFEIIKVDDDDA